MILECKPVRERILKETKEEISRFKTIPKLAIISAEGFNDASTVYVRNKIKTCEEVGIETTKINVECDNKTKEQMLNHLIHMIEECNNDQSITGMFVQLPLPFGIQEHEFAHYINPLKDIDAFNPINLGNLYKGIDCLTSCTPEGIMSVFDFYDIPLQGKDVVIVNRSQIVGIPLIALLLQKDCTVQICHSKTKDLIEKVSMADIVITAVGKANFMDETWFKEDAVVIDVSMNRNENGKLCGDIVKDSYDKIGLITPVPSGIGILTTSMITKNIVKAYKLQNNIN